MLSSAGARPQRPVTDKLLAIFKLQINTERFFTSISNYLSFNLWSSALKIT